MALFGVLNHKNDDGKGTRPSRSCPSSDGFKVTI